MRWSLVWVWAGGMAVIILPVIIPIFRLAPLIVVVMLVALQKSRSVWIVAIASTFIQEWISVAPVGAHLVEVLVVAVAAMIALRRVVSTSTWAQLGLATFAALAMGELAMAVWIIVVHALSPSAITPDWHIFATVAIRQVVVATLVTMVVWPFVRARWAPLKRVTYER